MIKEILAFIPIALVFMAFKSTLFSVIPLPDIPLLMVFYLAFRRPSVEGAAFAFVLGYMDDVLCGGIIGSTSFAYIVVFMLVHLAGQRLHFTTAFTRSGGAAIAVVLKGALVYAVVSSAGMHVRIFVDVLMQAILTGICAHKAIVLMSRLSARVVTSSFKGDIS
ncbi:MAG: rod shape-determining protein MreD [Deltaproteobacteria bacterium]|nr:rod shape-determining protein MreD [Deltaproteobacteria bacterium]